jgi:hypothetical protein
MGDLLSSALLCRGMLDNNRNRGENIGRDLDRTSICSTTLRTRVSRSGARSRRLTAPSYSRPDSGAELVSRRVALALVSIAPTTMLDDELQVAAHRLRLPLAR